MADVKVPPLLHKRSITAQKAWYKKHGMEMPQERSAAGAKKIKPVEVKPVEVPVVDKPKTAREISMERQKAYYAKGGRQPIGAGGSGGSSAMAGGGQSTIKDLKASIKAGFNPKVSLDPYESERAKKTGPRSLKMKKEEVQIGEALSPERKRMFDLKLKLIKKVANKKAYTKSSKVDSPHASLNPAADMKLNPRPPSGGGKEYYREEAQIDEVTKKEAESTLGGPVKEKPKMPPGKQPAAYRYVRGLARKAMKAGMKKEEVTLDEVTGYEGVKDRTDMIKRAAAMGRMGKNVFLARVKARAAEMRKQKAMKAGMKKEEVEQIDEEGGISHIIAKNKLQDHKDAMESEGYDTVTKSLPKDHPKAKTHIGIVAQSPVEHDYHSSMGHAEPMHEEVESVPTQRSNFIGKHHLKRDHSDELGSRYVFSTDPAKMKKSYSTEKGQKNAANRNVANLKATIKSSLGKHSKPNLPEEAELDEKMLTKAEMKKREEVAKAIKRDNPGMPMGKKMAIATATAKKVAEELVGNQHRIDANKNGKIDAHDFKLLKAKKKTMKEFVEQLAESLAPKSE